MKNQKTTFLILYASIVTIGLILSLFAFKNLKTSFEEIETQKISIVDGEGNRVMILANRDQMPQPFLDGKEYKRDINPSGTPSIGLSYPTPIKQPACF